MSAKKLKAADICANVDPRIREPAVVLAEQVLLMADRLHGFKSQMKNESLIVEYDNGGGQIGVRENPFFSAYEKLLSTFNRSLSTLEDLLGDSAPAKVSSLEEMRRKLKVAK